MPLITPNIIDVEASCLSYNSYPIEIGIVLGNGERYCSLIYPNDDWTDWTEEAEAVHHITRQMLCKHGKPIHQVALELNEFLEGLTVYSDCWVVDNPWVKKLFYTAKIEQRFQVCALEIILKEPQMEIWHDTKDRLLKGNEKLRHRATFDATLIQQTYTETAKAC